MDDLIAFLRERLDDDAQAARAAWDSHWRVELRPPMQHIVTVGDSATQDGVSVVSGAPAVLPHIARHDPARALVDVAAKRQIIDEHDDQHDCPDPRATDYPYKGCRTLRLLALPYADHADYNESWRP